MSSVGRDFGWPRFGEELGKSFGSFVSTSVPSETKITADFNKIQQTFYFLVRDQQVKS